MSKIEIFDVKVVVEKFNKQLDMNRMVKPRVQLMEMTPLDLPSFQMTPEQTQFSIGDGIEFLCRVDCFKTFRVSPIYIYICTESDQKICGGGIDISPLFIDAFRKSGQEQRHRAIIDLENYYREVIGNASFRVYVTHINSNINDVECLDDELREIEIKTKDQKLDLIIQDDADAFNKSRRSTMKKTTRDFPSLPDLLHMYYTYQSLTNDFEDEAFVTDEKALTHLQARWTRKMKQVQELRRKADVGQNLSELSDYNQITSSNAVLETPSDFSESEEAQETRDLLREIRKELNIRLPKKKPKQQKLQQQTNRPTQSYTQQMLQIQPTQQVHIKTEVLNQNKKPKEKPLKEIGEDTLGRLNRKALPSQEQKPPEPKKPKKKPTNRLAELAVKKYEPPKPPEPSPEEIKKQKQKEAKKKPKRLPPIILQTETIKKKTETDLKPKSQTQKEPIRQKKSPSPPKATTTTLQTKKENTKATTIKDISKQTKPTTSQPTKSNQKQETKPISKPKDSQKPTTATDSQKIPEKGKVTSTSIKGKPSSTTTTSTTKTDLKDKKQTLPQSQKDKKPIETKAKDSKETTKKEKQTTKDAKDSKQTKDTKEKQTTKDAKDLTKDSKQTAKDTKDSTKEKKKDKKPAKDTKESQKKTEKGGKETKAENKEEEKSQVVDTSKLSKEDLKETTDEGRPVKTTIEKENKKKKDEEESFPDSFLSTSTTQQSKVSKQQTETEKKSDQISIDLSISTTSEQPKPKAKDEKSGTTDIIESYLSTDKKESSGKLDSDIKIEDSFESVDTSTTKTDTTKTKDEIIDSFISETSSVVQQKEPEKKKEEEKPKSKDDIIDSFISETSSVVQQPEKKKEEEKKKDDDVEIIDSFISSTSTTKQTDTKLNDDLDMGSFSSDSTPAKEKSKSEEIVESYLSTATSAISQKDNEKEKQKPSKAAEISTSFATETSTQPSKAADTTSLVLDSFDTSDVSKQVPLKEEKIEDNTPDSKSKQNSDTSYSSLGEPLNIDSTGTISSKKSSTPKSEDSDSSFGFSSDDEIDALLNGSSKGKDALIGTLTNDQEKQIDEDIQGDDFLSLMNTENIQAKKSNADDFGDSVLSSDLSI